MSPERSPLRRYTFAAFVVLWGVLFVVGLQNFVHPARYPSVFVRSASSADDYPTITGFRSFLVGDDAGLRVGDRVLRVGTADLRGANGLRFFVDFVEQIGTRPEVEIEYERDGRRATATAPGGTTRMTQAQLPSSLAFAVAAIILWLRAARSRMSDAFIAFFMTVAIYQAAHFLGRAPTTYAVYATQVIGAGLLGPLALRAFLLFPEGSAPAGGMPRWPWLFAVLAPLHTGHFGWPVPAQIGTPAAGLVTAALLVCTLIIVGRRYRRADAIGKRRLRWLYFGLYCAAMPPVIAAVLAAIDPALAPFYFVSLISLTAIPIALLISIVRFNLFDVDRLISTAASFNLLLVFAIAMGAVIIPVTAEAAAELLGVDRWVSRFVILVPLGLVVVAANARIRRGIESVFFAERYALDTGVQELLAGLAACADAEALIRCCGDGVYRLFRPLACVVYARGGERFGPLYVEGATVPASFPAAGPLTATIHHRRVPLAFDAPGLESPVEFPAFERAVLETLDAAVVAPIWHAEELNMLLCVGAKRSGDVYTPTDLRLLASVADRTEVQLDKFEQTEVLLQSQRMQESLRRYVPGAVADALKAGRDLEAKEQEITVLFVDLRGYTSYCETLAPGQIFDTVGRYTATVSAILARYGGTLVEFNGDGMMAMFGAPEPLPAKESAAVRAAHELVVEVASLPNEDGAPLSVGVGISTGAAFVGSIRSHDHHIWTALGNTVNLAARLQGLTRELEALVAVDERTYTGAGVAAAGLQRRANVPIRGRSLGEDVFILPRTP